jgi:hypothetical protein
MKKVDFCRLCGKRKKLTFEHTPPAGAFNSSPVFFQDWENIFDKSSYLYGKRKRSNKGAGGLNLCKECNNNTGSWYANDYIKFSKIGAFVMTHHVYATHFITAEYCFKPLNILKQILTMFVALDSSKFLIKQPYLSEFLLERESKKYPGNFKIFMYLTSSICLRNPLSFSNMDGYFRTYGEISYRPFGFHISINSPPINRPYLEITHFKDFEYNQISNQILPLRYLEPLGQFPGLYAD